MIDIDDAPVTDFDKGFYMTAQDYADWVELFEEPEEGVQEL